MVRSDPGGGSGGWVVDFGISELETHRESVFGSMIGLAGPVIDWLSSV